MSIGFFIVGAVIFSFYVYFLIWNIFTSNKKQREENYPGYYSRHGMVDSMDMDSMGNFSRFPAEKPQRKKKTYKRKSSKKVKL